MGEPSAIEKLREVYEMLCDRWDACSRTPRHIAGIITQLEREQAERDEYRNAAEQAHLRMMSLYTPLWEHSYDVNDCDAQAIISQALRREADADRLERSIETLVADDIISASKARELHGMSADEQRAHWREMRDYWWMAAVRFAIEAMCRKCKDGEEPELREDRLGWWHLATVEHAEMMCRGGGIRAALRALPTPSTEPTPDDERTL